MKKFLPIFAAMAVMLLASDPAYAGDNDYAHFGAAFAMAFAVLGGALGQGMAAKGVYESISRNPNAAGKLNAPFYVGMAFMESLVLFTFVIAFLLQSK